MALVRELAANACRDSQEIGAPSAAKLFRDAPANSPRRSWPPPTIRRVSASFYLLLTKFLAARPIARIRGLPWLDFEQNKNKTRTINKQEMEMTDLVQDIVSLLSMSTFIVSMAMWIGAM